MAAVLPYLNFPGNCAEAFAFYQSVFGVAPAMKMQYKDIPGEWQAPGEGEKIMHIALPLCNNSMLMGADHPSSAGEFKRGSDMSVALGVGSEEEAHRLFNGLSEGGRVTEPLANAPWGALFGMFVDKFGVSWMLNYDQNVQSNGQDMQNQKATGIQNEELTAA